MEQVSLRAEVGREHGSRPSRQLRRDGRVPGVVYGRGLETRSVDVDRRELYTALHTEAGLNALINLQVGKDEYLTVAREIQRHPVRGDIMHLDFIQISLDVAIEAEVHVEFTGVPVGVSEEGGIVETVASTVTVSALPGDIPSSLALDISGLGVGDSLKVSDLPAVENVTVTSDPDMTLVTVVVPAALIIEAPEEEIEAEELEEGVEVEEGVGAPAAEAAESEEEG
jgi:large subunit ribosomal protein L25